MASSRKFPERIEVWFPKGTKAQGERAAGSKKFDTLTAYIRRVVLDAIETDLKEAKREKAR